VTLRDGVTIYVDVFRPVGTEKVPVLVAWSPYGKSQGTTPGVMGIFATVGLDNATVSGLAKFEGPDPAYWCAQGYAVCNPDPRGIAESEGRQRHVRAGRRRRTAMTSSSGSQFRSGRTPRWG